MPILFKAIREKSTWYLLLLLVPLEVLTFFCEPGSIAGKGLLIVKFIFIGVLFILYAELQECIVLILFFATTLAVGGATLIHGGTGIAFLILTMFMAMITFPRIELDPRKGIRLYLIFACAMFGVAFYGMLHNFINGQEAFSWVGIYNPNTFGMLMISIFFYLVSALYLDEKENEQWVKYLLWVIIIPTLFVIRCRSVLFSVAAFAVLVCFAMRKKSWQALYYLMISVCILICLVVAVIEQKLDFTAVLGDLELFGKPFASGRAHIWASALDGFLKSPLWGQSSEYLIENTGYSSAHSVLMGILVAVGLIPAMLYLFLLYTPRDLLCYKKDGAAIPTMNKLCFASSIVLTAFECVYTDNRLNMLFLPLLLGVQNGSITQYAEETEADSTLQRIKKLFTVPKPIVLCISVLLLAVMLTQSFLMPNLHILQSMDNQFYIYEGKDDYKENILIGSKFGSAKGDGIVWEWKGNAYEISGTAEETTFLNLYSSLEHLPEWGKPGQGYRILYGTENVSIRVSYYSESEGVVPIVHSKTDADFYIPEQATGLVVRLMVDKGVTVNETVMPVICPKENEH